MKRIFAPLAATALFATASPFIAPSSAEASVFPQTQVMATVNNNTTSDEDAAAGALALFIGFIFVLSGYMFPWIVAMLRGSRQSGPVFVLNLLLGWTFLGWVVALVIAVAPKQKDVIIVNDSRVSDK